MPGTKKVKFNPAQYLSASSLTRKTVRARAGHVFYTQGDPVDAIFTWKRVERSSLWSPNVARRPPSH